MERDSNSLALKICTWLNPIFPTVEEKNSISLTTISQAYIWPGQLPRMLLRHKYVQYQPGGSSGSK